MFIMNPLKFIPTKLSTFIRTKLLKCIFIGVSAFIVIAPLAFILTKLPLIISIVSFVASAIALCVSFKSHHLQEKADETLTRMEGNILSVEKNTGELSKINLDTQENVDKTHFFTERTAALNKYPDTKQLKSVNNAYQPFASALFDYDEYWIDINVNSDSNQEEEKKLIYNIQIIKDERTGIPKTEKALFSDLYIIRITPSDDFSTKVEEDLKKYEDSPIKEGEYYFCTFCQNRNSWVLSEKSRSLAPNVVGGYSFDRAFSPIECVADKSANEVMGYKKI